MSGRGNPQPDNVPSHPNMKTKKQVEIGYAGQLFPPVVFKVGTTCRLAKVGLSRDGQKQYWLSLPVGFDGGKWHKDIRSYAKNYGFLVKYSEIF